MMFGLVRQLIAISDRRPPDRYIGGKADPYMLRWHLVRSRWFNVYLHHMRRSDDDRALHDHPWANMSIVLRGGYIEHVPGFEGGLFQRYRNEGAVVLRRAEAAHRIELFEDFDTGLPLPTWSLFITGPRVREWGFVCPQGWRHWTLFTAFARDGNSDEIGPGCD